MGSGNESKRSPVEGASASHMPETTGSLSMNEIASQYLAAVLAGDRNEALRLIRDEAVGQGISVTRVYLEVIQYAQYEVGRMWEAGKVSIAQEHLATGIAQLAIAQLYFIMPRSERLGHVVLISCVPGETHDIGARILSDFYEMAGFVVRFLGSDTPVEEIIGAIISNKPSIVALSATMPYNLPAFEETVREIRLRFGRSVLIAAGGQAFSLTPELLDTLEIELRASEPGQLVADSRHVLGVL